MKNGHFLDQNHGFTPLKKCQFFYFFNFFLLYPSNTFSRSRISWKSFSWLILPKKKLVKWLFLDQNHGLTRLEKCQFFNFLNFVFYSLERRFFTLEYRKRHFLGIYCIKESSEKSPFLNKNHGLTLWKNVNFSTYWTSCFLA